MSNKKKVFLQDTINNQNKQSKFPQDTGNSYRQQYLNRNATESEVSYQGNTIDMVRIVKKNQEARRSRLNIQRKQYNKYQTSADKAHRFSDDPQHYSYDNYDKQDNFSTYPNIGGATTNQASIALANFHRMSQCELLGRRQPNSKIVENIILITFLVLFTSEFLVGSYYLNIGYFMDNLNNFKRVQLALLQYALDQNFFFVRFLTLLALCQVLYCVSIWIFEMKTTFSYKIIDPETSRIKYLLKGNNRKHKQFFTKISKNPKFTILIILVSSILYTFALSICFFQSQFQHFYFQGITHSSYHISILEILYFALILPQTLRYVFFDRMHVLAPENNNQHRINSSSSDTQSRSQYYKAPITRFNLNNWWAKFTIIIFILSIGYCFFTNIWLGVLVVSKLQMSFKKIKYRMDPFYIEFAAKLILLIVSFIAMNFFIEQDFQIQYSLSISWVLYLIVVITAFIIAHRALANIVLREQLYKNLYSQMHINLSLIVFVLLEILVFFYWTQDRIQPFTIHNLVLMIFSIILGASIYRQGTSRLFVSFEKDRQSDFYIEMEKY